MNETPHVVSDPFLTRRMRHKNSLNLTRPRPATIAALLLVLVFPLLTRAETVWLDDLYYGVGASGGESARKTKSVNGRPLTIAGQVLQRGFGTHAGSLHLPLGGQAQSLSARVGVDDQGDFQPPRRLEFLVLGDEQIRWRSGVMQAGDLAKPCAVDLTGVQNLELQVTNLGEGINYGHADWAEAKLEVTSPAGLAFHETSLAPREAPYVLTPPAPAEPQINGPKVYGVRPGSPVLYVIPATGDRPMTFAVEPLPAGLALDPQTGLITGSLKQKGEYVIQLKAQNNRGVAIKSFRLVCGDRIALTPPMGWNSWNCFASAVSAERVKSAADALVKSGLTRHGWNYINIDDYWQNHRRSTDPTLSGAFRDGAGVIQPNQRFPDMKGLADYVHGLGLKIGLYSSPGPWTCGGCVGSYGHEKQDAETYAKWGFDYLKYDWCSYGDVTDGCSPTNPKIQLWNHGRGNRGTAVALPPNELMGQALRQQPRDIVFSLCQYGMSAVWQWGDAARANCWRTTCDITDTWSSMSGIGFNQDQAAPYARPGNWNDPDMLVVGEVGWGKMHPSRLTPDEQYTHISLWCLLSAPLLIGCDLEKLDAFTLNLLENDEVLAVNQDALGQQATCRITSGDLRVYVKKMENGSQAVGFFNLGATPLENRFTEFRQLGLSGQQKVRDLWRQQDLALLNLDNSILSLKIPAHGVLLYRLAAPSSPIAGKN